MEHDDQEFRARGRALRARQLGGETLTEVEAGELAEYMRRIEAEEAERLRPARQRDEALLQRLQQRDAALERLIAEREALAARLRLTLDDAAREQARIDEEFRRLVLLTPEPAA
jgi:hypothetical protein